MGKFIAPVITLIILSGCTQINVRKIDSAKHEIHHVCINENMKVNVADFIDVMESKFYEYGITSEVYDSRAIPKSCKYIVKYTVKQSWDMTKYIGYAEINIFNRNEKIGGATYEQAGGSASLSLNKWGTTLEKIGPVLDQLLSKFSGQQPVKRKLTIQKQEDNNDSSVSGRLTALKELYEKKLINKADYDAKKKEILSDM